MAEQGPIKKSSVEFSLDRQPDLWSLSTDHMHMTRPLYPEDIPYVIEGALPIPEEILMILKDQGKVITIKTEGEAEITNIWTNDDAEVQVEFVILVDSIETDEVSFVNVEE